MLGCVEMVLSVVLFFNNNLHTCMLLLLLSFSLTVWHVWRQWQRLPRANPSRCCRGFVAAIAISRGYISLYPQQEIDPQPHELPRLLLAGQINDCPGCFLPSLAAEIADWRSPDLTFSFQHYNGQANRGDSLYNLTAKNCSTTVVDALDVAFEGYYGQQQVFALLLQPAFWGASVLRERAEIMTWTPSLVADYVRLMEKTLDACPGR